MYFFCLWLTPSQFDWPHLTLIDFLSLWLTSSQFDLLHLTLNCFISLWFTSSHLNLLAYFSLSFTSLHFDLLFLTLIYSLSLSFASSLFDWLCLTSSSSFYLFWLWFISSNFDSHLFTFIYIFHFALYLSLWFISFTLIYIFHFDLLLWLWFTSWLWPVSQLSGVRPNLHSLNDIHFRDAWNGVTSVLTIEWFSC